MIQHHWTIQTKCYLVHTKMKKINIPLPCSILFLLTIADKTIFTLSFNFHLFIHLLIRLLNTLEIYTLMTQITAGDSMPPLWGVGGMEITCVAICRHACICKVHSSSSEVTNGHRE